VLVVMTGCFNPVYMNPTCGPLGECPNGLSCNAQNLCVPPFDAGNTGDTQADAEIDAGLPVGECLDGATMRSIVAAAPGDVVITEYLPSPSGVADADGEWFEVYVTRSIDFNGVGLDRQGDVNPPQLIDNPNCLRVLAGSRAIFARNSSPTLNGGLPAVTATFTFGLITGSVPAPGDVRLMQGALVLDSVTWTTSTTGRSRQLDPEGHHPVSNDSEMNWCDSNTMYGTGGDRGTPTTSNAQCQSSTD
jgi:hypothetical protein